MVIAVPLISEVGNSMNHCDDKSEGPTSVSPISSSSPSARPHKIVVVEDDHEMQRLLKEELQEAGYQVTQASNGTEAFVQVEAVKPDVVVSDLLFPGGGLEFIRALRQKYENGRIIVITARSDERTRVEVEQLGVDAFLGKSIRMSELLQTINRLIELTNPQ